MPKKKFVDKRTASTFVLMHRSQQDADYGKDSASEFVLYPVQMRGANPLGDDDGPDRNVHRQTTASRDHVNELGLPNDGYDYSKHLREMGEK